MKWSILTLLIAAAFILSACNDAGPLSPPEFSDNKSEHENVMFGAKCAGPPALGVLTWNIYVGADLTQILAINDPDLIACAVADVYEDVLATDFLSRAVAIADQIEEHVPHVISLNEVSTFDFEYETIHNDLIFLNVLMAELTSRGLDYSAPMEARSTNFQITLPISYATDCEAQDLLAYTEYDALLVRGDVLVNDAAHGNYSVALPLPYGLPPKYSGWAYVDIEHKARPYRVFTTHLEPADTGPCATDDPGLLYIHSMQAAELMQILSASPYPTILTGDLNSDASGCTTDTYPDLIEAGFLDAWDIGRPRGNGYTANQDADLRNGTTELWHRIDFIMYRDAFTVRTGHFQGSVCACRVGEKASDRGVTSFGYLVWPSDHAGVFANLRIAPGLGHVE